MKDSIEQAIDKLVSETNLPSPKPFTSKGGLQLGVTSELPPSNWHDITGEELRKTPWGVKTLKQARALAAKKNEWGVTILTVLFTLISVGVKVQTWRDLQPGNYLAYVTSQLDSENNQVGDAMIDGYIGDAETAHLWMVADALSTGK